MTRWKLTDAYEMGYEYKCPVCGQHIDVPFKGRDLPDECLYCGSEMTVATIEEAILHFEHGVSHDIFTEPVTSYAKMAIAALREQPQWISVEERLPEPFVSVLVYRPGERPLPTVHEGFLARDGM